MDHDGCSLRIGLSNVRGGGGENWQINTVLGLLEVLNFWWFIWECLRWDPHHLHLPLLFVFCVCVFRTCSVPFPWDRIWGVCCCALLLFILLLLQEVLMLIWLWLMPRKAPNPFQHRYKNIKRRHTHTIFFRSLIVISNFASLTKPHICFRLQCFHINADDSKNQRKIRRWSNVVLGL